VREVSRVEGSVGRGENEVEGVSTSEARTSEANPPNRK